MRRPFPAGCGSGCLNMRKIFRHSFILPGVAFYLCLAGSAPFLGQWDSFDYLKQIVSHQLSPLGFGRPGYLAYNILLWESTKRVLHLEPLKVEGVVMIGTVLLGVLGVLLFRRLARCFLSPPASRMAALAFALSPVYAVYSGFIMTEVPMLVALMSSALILLKPNRRHPALSAALSGVSFGMAIGIREQALTMGAAFLWLLCSRREAGKRVHAILVFGGAAAAVVLLPVLGFYFLDPAGFVGKIGIWLHAIPMGQVQFWKNIQASLLYVIAICPAAWMAAGAAGLHLFFKGRPLAFPKKGDGEFPALEPAVQNPILGVFCCVAVPIVVLWRDADIQIHPRYALIALPGSIIFCSAIYDRWIRSRKGPAIWAVVHVLVFGAAIAILSPFRQVQNEKMHFAEAVKDTIPGKALMIAGSYDPIFDYYRGIGVRPQWQILWTGWGPEPGAAENLIRKSWADQIPVYMSEDPLGWRYFEPEYLHFYFFLKDCRKEPVIPKLFRIYPSE
jgi:hypothetical protein